VFATLCRLRVSGGDLTATEQVTSKRLQYCRTIMRNLARQRFNDPNWRLDDVTAVSMKRLVRRMLGNAEAPRRIITSKPKIAAPQQGEFCAAHLLRTGERRAIYKAGLCKACFEGDAVKESETYGESFKVPDGIPPEPKPQTPSLAVALAQLEAITAQFEVQP